MTISLATLKHKYTEMPVQVRAAFWFLICGFLQRGINVISTPIFTRLLSPSEYGQFNIFNSWMGIATIVITLNLFYGVYTQGLIKFDKERDVYSSSLQGLTACLCIVWTVVYLCCTEFFNNLFSMTEIQGFSMLAMIWLTAVFNFWAGEQRVLYKYKSLVVMTLIVSFLKPAVGVVFVLLSEDKVTARILGILVVEIVLYFWLFFLQVRKGRKLYSSKFWNHALSFNIPLVPHYLSQIVLSSADRIMIGDMIGEAEAGIYSLAYSVALIMTIFNTSLMQTISPWLYQKIKLNKITDIAPVAYSTLIMIASVNLVIILLAPEVVMIFAPPSYYDAMYVIPPVAMSVYFMYAYDLFAKFAFYYEKTKMVMTASVFGAALNVILNYIFIDLYGYIAAGYTTLVCYVVYCVGHYMFMNKVCSTYCNSRPYNLQRILTITTAFLAFGTVLLFTYQDNIIRYTIVMISVVLCIIKRHLIIEKVKKIIEIKRSQK